MANRTNKRKLTEINGELPPGKKRKLCSNNDSMKRKLTITNTYDDNVPPPKKRKLSQTRGKL